ncbi:hypothetical protein OEA41_009387 [Lepraria neglecta]|uniref:Uncharacterized protein n=1 Tax=Lepraria neglecta TaxID=209136 RepID=A0AAD9Z4S3_9LECA|nr:hypothetical protein OEA41_009387 [Lepraria neglecta]
MVQGLPAVKWTPENNAKLLQALVIMHAGVLDYKKLAAIFGPNVPVAAIQYRLGVLRKEGAALGLSESKSSPAKAYTPKIGKRAGIVPSEKGKGKGKKRGGMLRDDARYDEEHTTFGSNTDISAAMMRPWIPLKPMLRAWTLRNDAAAAHTSPTPSAKREKTIGGRVTKARISPRKTAKKDYKALEDPFVGVNAIDVDGEKVFGTDKSDSEDPYASDEEFGVAKKIDAVKTEVAA